MYKKRFILLIILAIILTGCSKIDNNIDSIVNATMINEVKKVNTGSTSYKLYIPIGVIQLVDNEYNQKFKIRDFRILAHISLRFGDELYIIYNSITSCFPFCNNFIKKSLKMYCKG